MEYETDIELTWKTPRLFRGHPRTEGEDKWFVAMRSFEKDDEGYEYHRYLGEDGSWYCGMKVLGRTVGGTYFATLQEVINVLCEFEIDVVNDED